MKKKENNKLVIALIAVVLIIVIVGGATFAYWSWSSNDSQKTNVNITVTGATMIIDGNNITNTGMYPTVDCDGDSTGANGALIGDTATVTVTNDTASPMQASLKIRATLTKSHGTLNETNRAYLKWAIVEMSSATATAVDNACSTNKVASGTLASVSASNTDIDTGITFVANANAITVKYYKLYVWLDSGYTFTNSGSAITDPMQDLTISVKWSPASSLNQQY